LLVGVRFVANLLFEEVALPESVVGGTHILKKLDHVSMKWNREAFEYGEESTYKS